MIKIKAIIKYGINGNSNTRNYMDKHTNSDTGKYYQKTQHIRTGVRSSIDSKHFGHGSYHN